MKVLVELAPYRSDPEGVTIAEAMDTLVDALAERRHVDLRCEYEGVRLAVQSLEVLPE